MDNICFLPLKDSNKAPHLLKNLNIISVQILICFVATHKNAKIQVCFCTFATIGAIVIWQVSMETAAGDCWVTVTGNVTMSTQHLQCRTWTRTPQKIFSSYDDEDDDENDVHKM